MRVVESLVGDVQVEDTGNIRRERADIEPPVVEVAFDGPDRVLFTVYCLVYDGVHVSAEGSNEVFSACRTTGLGDSHPEPASE